MVIWELEGRMRNQLQVASSMGPRTPSNQNSVSGSRSPHSASMRHSLTTVFRSYEHFFRDFRS